MFTLFPTSLRTVGFIIDAFGNFCLWLWKSSAAVFRRLKWVKGKRKADGLHAKTHFSLFDPFQLVMMTDVEISFFFFFFAI